MAKEKEALRSNAIMAAGSALCKLLCAVKALNRLQMCTSMKSFGSVCMYPMDYRFVRLFQKFEKKSTMKAPEVSETPGTPKTSETPKAPKPRATPVTLQVSVTGTDVTPRKYDGQVPRELMAQPQDESIDTTKRLQLETSQLSRENTTNSVLQDALRVRPHSADLESRGRQSKRLPRRYELTK